ncbi:efflux RND transporter periplasmic adaptor subunit [Consotaella salsifontis]|uniref:Membrane fusion protein, macrolide-specific efflux system n=1 Tax=Consotaella salsifontis TaxID=1365950 RepID=A0A1T4P019_9HYPH|nr:efflux RND transporter periplasmic adaptor subunit [Consotaella salsifontis]SJZ84781.1 membrane fusion protein, macrolide-specific efflux system [Consotaella salsifontis]
MTAETRAARHAGDAEQTPRLDASSAEERPETGATVQDIPVGFKPSPVASPSPEVRRPPRRKKPSRGRRLLIFLVLLLLVAAGGWYAKNRYYPATTAPNVLTAPVTVGTVEETVLADGTLKPLKLVAVGAQVSGRVVSVPVVVGQKVKAGDLVGQIDPKTRENDLKTAEASLAQIKAERDEREATLALNVATLARQQKTAALQVSTAADLDTAQAAVETTKAQIAALDAEMAKAEVAVATAQLNLGYTHITAPINGTVLAVVTQEGQTVNATQSAPTIVILGQLDTMIIRAEISEVDVTKVKPGEEIYFTILGDPGRRFEAKLESIEPAPESIKSDSAVTSSSSAASSSSSSSTAIYYNGVFTVPNPDGYLKTYMTAEVHIVVGKAENVLTIPSAALKRRNRDGSYEVDVLEGDQVVSRSITVGLNDNVTAEVKSGLQAGDKVVTGQASGGPRTSSFGGRRGPPMGF